MTPSILSDDALARIAREREASEDFCRVWTWRLIFIFTPFELYALIRIISSLT